MNFPYTLRLLCLCGASFFLIHMALALTARLAAGNVVRLAEHMKPQAAARLLFTFRLAPLWLSLIAVLAFCIPSYLWLEPEATGEKVGLLCVLMAALGVALWAPAVKRVIGAVRGTNRFLSDCARHGRKIAVPGEDSPALLVSDKAPVLAVAGVFRQQLLISRRVLRELSAEQREAALRHEHAHRASGDNLKRLLILLAPDAVPFLMTFSGVERAWSRFVEWAADDEATSGDPQRALSLASALVQVAKMKMGSRPRADMLSCSLIGGNLDLSERVDRLLRPQPKPDKPVKEVIRLVGSAGALVASAIAVVAVWPSSLSAVHQALEHLVH
ncbi:MAG TPA: M56 family metallopeptidase [Bryocella sp.]|nr:M56 family metallopeptidase [Bryocella sp.]